MLSPIELFKECVDTEGQISTSFLKDNGYKVIFFSGDVENIYVELFCKSSLPASHINIVTAFNKENIEVFNVRNDRTSVYVYLHDSVRWVIAFGSEQDGFFFKQPLGDYYVVFGEAKFLDRFFPVSHMVAIENFRLWVESLDFSAKKFYIDLLEKYRNFIFTNNK